MLPEILISQKDRAKFFKDVQHLAVIIDHKLTWKSHITNVIYKVTEAWICLNLREYLEFETKFVVFLEMSHPLKTLVLAGL